MIHRKYNNYQGQNNEGCSILNQIEHVQGSGFICMDEPPDFVDAVAES